METMQVNDVMTDILSGPVLTNIPSEPIICPMPPPQIDAEEDSRYFDLSSISSSGYNLVHSLSNKLEFFGMKSTSQEVIPSPETAAAPAPAPAPAQNKRKSIAAAKQSFGTILKKQFSLSQEISQMKSEALSEN
jgi:hypothetical protein